MYTRKELTLSDNVWLRDGKNHVSYCSDTDEVHTDIHESIRPETAMAHLF